MREGAVVALFSHVGVPDGEAFYLSILLGLTNLAISLPGGLIWLLSDYKQIADNAPTETPQSNIAQPTA